ncbi:MAG: acyl carrier protein phosphodiesterase [Caulobacteraceae bacterium]|nr:acyl carrier protein phosphodiesterase [Caulobacteraceae bacterium]
MSKLLVIDSSASGEASVSRQLTAAAIDAFRAADPAVSVVYRDLDASPPPHLNIGMIAGVRTPSAATPAEQAARAQSFALLDEVRAADTIVIGAPMYNFSVPTVLRAWLDHVLRPGDVFRYSAAGPEGLLGGRRVIVIETRGGLYSEGPAAAVDFQEPYLRHLFAFAGITDVTFVRAEKVGYGPEARDAAIAAATLELATLAQAPLKAAA